MRTNCDGSAGREVVFGYFQALWALGLLAGQKDELVAWGRGSTDLSMSWLTRSYPNGSSVFQ